MLAPKLIPKWRNPLAPKINLRHQHISITVAKINLAKKAIIAMIVEAVQEVLADAVSTVETR